MASSLPRGDIAGATVAIAKDGEVLLTKGYGYADTQKRVPVDADRHLFRVASISKLFTWTAVMQQVERGRIDLDADINRYRSEEHTSELQSLMRISYAVFCLKKKKTKN